MVCAIDGQCEQQQLLQGMLPSPTERFLLHLISLFRSKEGSPKKVPLCMSLNPSKPRKGQATSERMNEKGMAKLIDEATTILSREE